MKRNYCISCGKTIEKTAFGDPYVCRGCEADHGVDIGRYRWLDSQ